jgi:hypothetical protein
MHLNSPLVIYIQNNGGFVSGQDVPVTELGPCLVLENFKIFRYIKFFKSLNAYIKH